MLNADDLEYIGAQLEAEGISEIFVDGLAVTIVNNKEFDVLEFQTPVFYGGNYIPDNIRRSSHADSIFHPATIKPRLYVDEAAFNVNAEWDGYLEHLNDFIAIAGEWRAALARHGKDELQFLYVNRSVGQG